MNNEALQDAIKAAKQFATIKEFRVHHRAFYSRIAKAKAYDVAFAHMGRMRVTQSDYEKGRHCTKCKEWHPIEMFLPVRAGATRRRATCKNCHAKTAAQWRAKNPERAREFVNQSAKRYPEKARERSAVKRNRNPEAFAARYLLKRILALTGERKNTKTEAALGYSREELRNHIQSQFQRGMSWDNWGEWHIDHVTPVAVMVRNGETRPEIINALSNLQPIWAKENLTKIWDARADNRKNRATA